MLRTVPKHWFSSEYRVLENDTTIASVDSSLFREAATLTVKGATYRAYRKGWMSGVFILEGGGTILARAVKPSAFIDHSRSNMRGANIPSRPNPYGLRSSSCLKEENGWGLFIPSMR
jgi:hypothetical protein